MYGGPVDFSGGNWLKSGEGA